MVDQCDITKTIFIEFNDNFLLMASRWLYSITGLLFLANGILNILEDKVYSIQLIYTVFFIVIGIAHIVWGLVISNKETNFNPKVSVDDSGIQLKRSLFGPGVTIKWSDLHWIEFGSLNIKFGLGRSSYVFSFTNSKVGNSTDIMHIIRKMAEKKSVKILGENVPTLPC